MSSRPAPEDDLREVSDRHYQALRASEAEFRAFVTATSDVVYRMSADWREMRQLQGREFLPDTVDVSITWLEKYIPENERPRVLAAIAAAIERGGPFELEHQVLRADGTIGWTFSRAIAVRDETGTIVEWLGAARDVTAQVEALDRLAEANRVKDEFLATLSHELRTPLNAVLGWASILRSNPLPRQVQERALEALERNARAQVRLVEELLDVSRIMTGKLVVRTAPIDLRRVVADAADAVRPAARAKRLTLDVTALASPLVVHGDAQRLQQIVWNLLSNAVKFTPDEGRIDTRLSADEGHAVIEVQDSGEGIDAAFLPRVFERFQQADSGPARRHGGLGLGLALVRHLTEAHGGTVAVASDGKDRGTTFRVRIPLALD